MFANENLFNYKLYANNLNTFSFLKNDMDNYMKQLLQLKAEYNYLQNSLTLVNEMIEQLRSSNSESIAEILQNLMKQLTNFNKRMINIEEGFFKTAKTVTWLEQAKEYFNRNAVNFMAPQPSQIQASLFNEFLNIENLTTPKIISDQLKKVFASEQISLDRFANMIAKSSTQYLVETINSPKNWFELTIKARNMFKDIYVWLKLNNLLTPNNNQNNSISTNEIFTNNFQTSPVMGRFGHVSQSNSSDDEIKTNNIQHNISFNNEIINNHSPSTHSGSVVDSNEHSIHATSSSRALDKPHEMSQGQRSRTKKRLNKKQYEELVKFYTLVSFYPKSKQLNELGHKLDLSLKFIQNWFANRRRRDNLDRTVSKRKVVNCKLNKVQKDALNALFCKNPYASKEEMRELAERHNLDYGAVSRWLNIKRSTNERLLNNRSGGNLSDEGGEDYGDNNKEMLNSSDNEICDDAVNDDCESAINYNVDDDGSICVENQADFPVKTEYNDSD